MRPIRTALSAAMLAALSFAAAAAPASLTVTFDNPIFGQTSEATRYDAIALTYLSASGTRTLGTQAGRFTGVASNPTNFDLSLLVDLNAAAGVQFAMYCYDLEQTIGAGNVVRYTVDFDGETQRTRNFLGAVNAELNKDKAQPDPYAWLRPGNALAGAAIQIGLWESLYDTSSTWSVAANAGSFHVANLDAATNSWLGSFFARLNSGNFTALAPEAVIVLRSGSKQDMITGDPPVDVPLPGTLSLLALGAASLALRRRRS